MTRLLLLALALASGALKAGAPVSALSPSETLEQAAFAWRGGDSVNAERWLLNALAKDPSLSRARLLLGLVYAGTGRGDDAEEQLLQAAGAKGLAAESRHNLGTLYFKNGRYREAADSFKAALKAGGQRPDSLSGLGIVLLKLQDWAGAEKAFRQAINSGDDSWQALAGLGEALSSQGRAAAALSAWSESHAKGGGDEVLLKLAGAYYVAGKNERAAEALQDLKSAESPEALYLAGCVASQRGRLDQALKQFEKAAALDPKNGRARLALAVTRYDRREYEEALSGLDAVLKASPENIRAIEMRSQVQAAAVSDLLEEAGSLLVEGETMKARRAAERASAMDPGNDAARDLFKSLDQLAQAAPSPQASRREERSQRAATYAAKGRRSFENEDWALAARQLSQALRLGAKGDDLEDMLSQARSKTRQAAERKNSTAKSAVVAADPAKVRELYLQGVYAYAGGDTAQAVQAWGAVLKLDPGHLQAKDALEEAQRKLDALSRLKKKS